MAVRSLACGDPIRRLVAKCFCVAGKEEISKSFAGRNSVEVVAHSLRDCLKEHEGSKLGLLNSERFQPCEALTLSKLPAKCFLPCQNGLSGVGEASMLLYDHQHIIESCAGVQQGDPLGPLHFCGIRAW